MFKPFLFEVNEVKLVLQTANYFRRCARKFGRKM